MVTMAGVVSMGAAANEVHDVVRTKKLQVVNDVGTELVYAGSSKGGHGFLTVNSKTGQPLVVVMANPRTDDGALIVNSKTGQQIVAQLQSGTNGGLMILKNKTGESVVQLGVDKYGNGEVGAYNREGMGPILKPGP